MTEERRRVIELLAELSEVYPAMRFGQIVNLVAALARGPAPESIYDAEDDELVRAAEGHLRRRSGGSAVAPRAGGG
jgi:hypothetical protein